MGGGRERSVIVWEVHWTLLSDRYNAVRNDLEQLAEAEKSPSGKAPARLLELEVERQRLLLELSRLGPAPRAKMG